MKRKPKISSVPAPTRGLTRRNSRKRRELNFASELSSRGAIRRKRVGSLTVVRTLHRERDTREN